jgi:hypothetical protein
VRSNRLRSPFLPFPLSPFLLILILVSICFADMTIYFKDGTSLNVSKIVFRQSVADLYLPDGTMQTFAVDKIDLKSSGIPRAEGTYGQTKLTPSITRPPVVVPAKPLTGDPRSRQIQLKEDWDHAERSAIALNDIGPIHQGDLVRISNESTAGSVTENTAIETPDGAYIVIYISKDGLIGKKLFDAASFQSNFKLSQKELTPPEPIIIPPKATEIKKDPVIKTKPPAVTPKPVVPVSEETSEEETPKVAVRESSESFPILPISIAAGGIAIVGGALFVYSRKKKKAFLNVTKFKQFEDELRDFEFEIWLKHGRTMDQLMEIGTKKFYQDQPNPLAAAMKMLKGADRLSIVNWISHQGGSSSESANEVYAQLHQRMEWIRQTIKAVSSRTGFAPLEQGNPLLDKTQSHIRKEVQSAVETSRATRKQEISDPEISPSPIAAATSQAQRAASSQSSTGGLPVYLKNVLKHLGDLSD